MFKAGDWQIKIYIKKFYFKIIVSVILLTICAVVILDNYPDKHIEWAFGMIGVIVGHWIK